jgi:hypothetical protein
MDEQISTWMDWIWSSRCLELLCTSTQSSNLKWVSGGGINSPRHSKSRWLTATEKVSVGWTDAILFKASVHQVPLPRHIAVEVLWQNCSDAMLRGASDHPVLKDSSPNPYCMHLQERRMNRCITVGSSGAEGFVLAHLCLVQTWSSDRPTVQSNRPSVHPVLLSSRLQLNNSSDATRMWTIGSSDGANSAGPLRTVPSTPTLASRVPSVHPTVPFPVFLRLWLWFNLPPLGVILPLFYNLEK